VLRRNKNLIQITIDKGKLSGEVLENLTCHIEDYRVCDV